MDISFFFETTVFIAFQRDLIFSLDVANWVTPMIAIRTPRMIETKAIICSIISMFSNSSRFELSSCPVATYETYNPSTNPKAVKSNPQAKLMPPATVGDTIALITLTEGKYMNTRVAIPHQ